MNEASTSFPHAHITSDRNYNQILTYINRDSHFQRAQQWNDYNKLTYVFDFI